MVTTLALSMRREASTRLLLSGEGWLRAHFLACETEYRHMLGTVGVKSGYCVLDAGCGPGLMLPELARLVGGTGSVFGIDVSNDFVAAADEVAGSLAAQCDVRIRHASILNLPFPAGIFDVVWCANVIEYLNDQQLDLVLEEFRRVTKPEGIVAIKDWDGWLMRVHPSEPKYFWHLFEKSIEQNIPFATNVRGFFRINGLAAHFRKHHCADVRTSSFLIDHRAPLTTAKKAWAVQALEMFRSVAENLDLPDEDRLFWEKLRDPSAPEHPVNHPDFLFGEANTMVTGIVA